MSDQKSVRFRQEQVSAFSGIWCPKSQEYAGIQHSALKGRRNTILKHVNNN